MLLSSSNCELMSAICFANSSELLSDNAEFAVVLTMPY